MRAHRKGISPLIAVVLLVAFTIAVGAIIGAWVTGFSRERSEELGEAGGQAVACSGGIIDFDWDDVGVTTVLVDNRGSVDLYDFSAIGFNTTASETYSSTTFNETSPLNSGEPGAVTFSVAGKTNTNLSSWANVRVLAGNCPEISHTESAP